MTVLSLLAALGLGCGDSDEGPAGGGGNVGGTGGTGGTGGGGTVGEAVTSVWVAAAAGAALPEGIVTFGQAFREGDVAASVVAELGGELLPTQVDAKRRHPDGSLRHAVISIRLPALPAGAEQEIALRELSDGPTPTGMTVEEALSGGLAVAIEVTESGSTYRATAAELLQGGEVERWQDGELVTTLRAAGPLQDGSSEHPALWVALDLRLLSTTDARVSVAVENAFADTPGDRTYDVTITSGSEQTEVFGQAGVVHYHHARWRHVHHLGDSADPYRVRADLAYLADVGVIPRYDPSVTISEATVQGLADSWSGSNTDILGNGIVEDYFPTTGGRGDIGPLPRWTALALLSAEARAFEVMLGVGDLAGSFSVHYRDRTSGRALSIDDYPTVTLNSSAAQWSEPEDQLPACDPCTSPYTVDDAHQPSLVFVPYLLTGDPYYLDELYFWTSYNFIAQNFDYRGDDQGWLHRQQVRGQAWTLRTLLHAAWIAPEEHPEAAYLGDKVANNLTWYADNGVDSNPFGWWGEQSNWSNDGGRPDDNMAADVRYYTSPWQSDFLIWTFDTAVGLGHAEAAPVRQWLAGYVVGRFTQGPDFNPYDGAPYHLATSSDTGTAYGTWSEIWQKSFANRTDPPPTELPSASCALCYPAIARVALTGALHGDVPDAQAAYDFVDAELQPHAAEFDEDPTWAIVP
ncbi:MAG: hypothetical protein JRI55_36655 [Deltaproteobacteria bacterium]|nr:hypothetical protein [Deltaproteobacteria bacterium]